jgi:hypothetical protein
MLDGVYPVDGPNAVLYGPWDAGNKVWSADMQSGPAGSQRVGRVIFVLSDDHQFLFGSYYWSNIGDPTSYPWWGVRA